MSTYSLVRTLFSIMNVSLEGSTMKKHRKIFQLIAVIAALLLFAGCASLSGGNLQYMQAMEEDEKGKGLDALYDASETLLKEPGSKSARKFLYNNYDEIIQYNLSRVQEFAAPYSLDELNDLAHVYWRLNGINRNLTQSSFPFTSQLHDYQDEAERYTLMAMKAYTDEVRRAIANNDLENAGSLGDTAIRSFYVYTSAGHQKAYNRLISLYYRYARRNARAKGVNRMERAEKVYNIIIYIDADDETAKSELDTLFLRLSNTYYRKGVAQRRKGTPDSYAQAMEYFTKSLEYNQESERAAKAVDDVRNKLADLSHAEG